MVDPNQPGTLIELRITLSASELAMLPFELAKSPVSATSTAGARQGEMFSTAIQDFELPWNAWLDGEAVVVRDGSLPTCELPGGMKLTLLSPTPAFSRSIKEPAPC